MREEFEKLVAAGKILNKHVVPLVTLTECGYCQHRSWGFGKITQLDTVFGRFQIDFQNKPGHSMDLAFAADNLRAIPRDHILARKSENLPALRQMAAVQHLDLIKLVLNSFDGKATPDQIHQVLVPDVITEDWKKWWEAAKREMRRDGHFVVPLKKAEPVLYQETVVSLADRLMEQFRAARGLKARLVVAAELLRSLPDISEPQPVAQEAIQTLNAEINSHQRTMPSLALEAIFMRDDLRAAASIAETADEVTALAIWRAETPPEKILEGVTAAKYKRALISFKEAQPESWQATLLELINQSSTKLCTECANLLADQGHLDALKVRAAQLVSHHTASSEMLLWLAKERSDAFADVLGPEVFRAMLTAMERDQFNEKKSNRLGDYVLEDKALIIDLTESADVEVVKDLVRSLQFSPTFTDMDKRALLGRLVKHFPAIQSLISGDHARQDHSLLVSWPSLEKRKEEYDELVHKRIPANSREIAVARSYGDLSENHEYKAAKEAHRLLMLRKSELESQLGRARGTDFANPRTDVVSVGTAVAVTDLVANQKQQFTILGAWDFDLERHIISYLSPIAQAMLNKKSGEEVEFEMEGHPSRYRIEAISAATPPAAEPAPPLATPAAPPASPTMTVPMTPAASGDSPSPETSSAASPEKTTTDTAPSQASAPEVVSSNPPPSAAASVEPTSFASSSSDSALAEAVLAEGISSASASPETIKPPTESSEVAAVVSTPTSPSAAMSSKSVSPPSREGTAF